MQMHKCMYIHTYIHTCSCQRSWLLLPHTLLLHIFTAHYYYTPCQEQWCSWLILPHTFTAHYYYTPCHIIATHFTAHYYYTPLQEQWCSWLLLSHSLLHTLLLHTMPRTVVLLSALLACLAVTEPDFTVSYIFCQYIFSYLFISFEYFFEIFFA